MYQDVTLTIENRIAHIEINRPECLNAIRIQTYQDIIAAMKEADASDESSVVVLSGANNVFTAGNDLSDLVGDSHDVMMQCVQDIIETGHGMKKPVIAAVEKVAVGIGSTILLHCDMVIAAENTKFRMPFVNLGVCAEGASSYLLAQQVGPKIAAELLLTGRFFSAVEAEKWGFINRTCEPKQALEQAMELAKEMVKLPLPSILETKRLMRQHSIETVAQVSRDELNAFVPLLQSEATQARIGMMLKGGK